MRRVLVLGASGNTGRVLLRQLRETGLLPVAGVRDERAVEKIPTGCEYRMFSYGDPDLTASALDGIQGLFLLVPFHEQMVSWGEQVVAHAGQRGIEHIVRLSGLGAAPDCASKMGALHGRIDRHVAASGIPYCILRCNSFMQNFSGIYRRGIQRDRVISLPEGDAESCFIDTADIAAVAATVFSDPAAYLNQTLDLSGPEPLSNADIASLISDVIGTEVCYRAISDAEAERLYRDMGVSPWKIEVLTSLSQFIRKGHAGTATAAVRRVLGRPPNDFRTFATARRRVWSGYNSGKKL